MQRVPVKAMPLALEGAYGPGRFVPSAWVSQAEFERLRADPALAPAVARFAGSLIDAYSGNALLNMLLSDRGRVVLGFFVAYLDVLPLPGTRSHGATLQGIQELCRRSRLCSAGRAASVLAAMRFGGYIVPRTDPEDGRRRILVPTSHLLEAHQRNWAHQFEAMSLAFPGAALALSRLERPSFRTAFLRALGTYFLAGFRVLDHVPVLERLAESNAGLLILSSLALRRLAGADKADAPSPLSISALARRFHVSRAHVRNLLIGAESAGMVADAPATEGIIVRPALSEALLQFFGVLFIVFDRCAAAALHEETSTGAARDAPN